MKPNLEKIVMGKIKSDEIKIKPKWLFVLGSLALIGGLTALIVQSVFLVSLMTFSLRTHGPMGAIRYDQLLSNFPWGAPIVAALGIGLGIWLLKRYDFSYKKNFLLIATGFVLAVLLAGLLINYLGIDGLWMNRGPMRGLYERYHGGGMMRGPGLQMMQENGYYMDIRR
jgi:hypothetical protein